MRVSEAASRLSTSTDQLGKYTLTGLGSPHLRFEKDGYVGYYQWKYIEGSSIAVTLATMMNQQFQRPARGRR